MTWLTPGQLSLEAGARAFDGSSMKLLQPVTSHSNSYRVTFANSEKQGRP